VLYVDEEISVQRQLARGRMIREHNVQVKKSGQGIVWEDRVTDNNETASAHIRFSSVFFYY
jgi:adenylate kinase